MTMYNRYIPQQDGSHRRNRMQEPDSPPAPPKPQKQPDGRTIPEAPEKVPFKPPVHSSPMGFLRQLLPKDFDTGDLIVVLLLLLMAGDKPEDRNTALLTLALYCFL